MYTYSPLRIAAWVGFFAIVIWAWWVMYSMAMKMGREPMNMHDFGPLVAMWAIMMAAMMGPSFVPTLQTYEDLIHSAQGTRLGWFGLIAGYFAVWIAFAILISAVQYWLIEARILTRMGRSMSGTFSAGLLLAAGLYQFTSLKEKCLRYCRSPMLQFLAHWRSGFSGGAVMGARLGAYCVLCCWGLMVIGFVGGVMDLIWMGGATLLILLEKFEDIGRWLTRPVGVALIAWALYIALKTAGFFLTKDATVAAKDNKKARPKVRIESAGRIDQRMGTTKHQKSALPWAIKGELFLNCSCEVFCPCVVSLGRAGPTEGHCHAWMAISIDSGHFDGEKLDGINIGLLADIPGRMGEGMWKVALYIDESASYKAFHGICQILSGKAGGSTTVLSMLVGEVLGAERTKVDIEADGPIRRIKVGRKIDGEIEMVRGKDSDQPVIIKNTKYWMGPDIIVAKGNKSRLRDKGRVWDFGGKSAEICPIDWTNQ